MKKIISSESMAAAKAYLSSTSDTELCGLFVGDSLMQKFIPCRNDHKSPKTNFRIHYEDWISAEERGRIVGIAHSHLSGGMKNLSSSDRILQYLNKNKITWVLFSDGKINEYPPFDPLKGREFIDGVIDCYDSFRDFYRLAGIEMDDYLSFRQGEWYKVEGCRSPFLEFIELENFHKIKGIESIEPGDVILSLFGCEVPNHASIYIGNNMIFHHLPGKLSFCEPLRDFYKKYCHSVWRYNDRESIDIQSALHILNSEY